MSEPLEYLDIKGLCRKIGGTRPIDASTAYRHIQAGRLPKPVKLGRLARWRQSEVDAALKALADARGK